MTREEAKVKGWHFGPSVKSSMFFDAEALRVSGGMKGSIQINTCSTIGHAEAESALLEAIAAIERYRTEPKAWTQKIRNFLFGIGEPT